VAAKNVRNESRARSGRPGEAYCSEMVSNIHEVEPGGQGEFAFSGIILFVDLIAIHYFCEETMMYMIISASRHCEELRMPTVEFCVTGSSRAVCKEIGDMELFSPVDRLVIYTNQQHLADPGLRYIRLLNTFPQYVSAKRFPSHFLHMRPERGWPTSLFQLLDAPPITELP
jgi:hypothetical protein